MHTETLPTAPSRPARLWRIALAAMRALVPQWMLHDDVDPPRHHRMGAWESGASMSARDAIEKARVSERR